MTFEQNIYFYSFTLLNQLSSLYPILFFHNLFMIFLSVPNSLYNYPSIFLVKITILLFVNISNTFKNKIWKENKSILFQIVKFKFDLVDFIYFRYSNLNIFENHFFFSKNQSHIMKVENILSILCQITFGQTRPRSWVVWIGKFIFHYISRKKMLCLL